MCNEFQIRNRGDENTVTYKEVDIKGKNTNTLQKIKLDEGDVAIKRK